MLPIFHDFTFNYKLHSMITTDLEEMRILQEFFNNASKKIACETILYYFFF